MAVHIPDLQSSSDPVSDCYSGSDSSMALVLTLQEGNIYALQSTAALKLHSQECHGFSRYLPY